MNKKKFSKKKRFLKKILKYKRRGIDGMLAWAIATLYGHYECFKSKYSLFFLIRKK